MTKFNSLNVNSKLNKLKSRVKNVTELTSNVPSNMIGDSNDGTNFRYKLLLINTQFSRLCKASAKISSENM